MQQTSPHKSTQWQRICLHIYRTVQNYVQQLAYEHSQVLLIWSSQDIDRLPSFVTSVPQCVLGKAGLIAIVEPDRVSKETEYRCQKTEWGFFRAEAVHHAKTLVLDLKKRYYEIGDHAIMLCQSLDDLSTMSHARLPASKLFHPLL